MNKHRFIWLLIILLGYSSCNYNENSYVLKLNAILIKQKKNFGKKIIYISGLLDFFPEIKSVNTIGHYVPPSCPPDVDCYFQAGNAIIIGNKKDYLQDFKKAVDSGIVYKTVYFNSDNFIIDIRELKNKLFPINKCNKFRKNKMPIPYFEGYDFGLGEKKTLEKQLEGEPRPRYRTIYNVPKDLKVYVIDAKAGNFWIFDCKENRPKALKQWQHGYSKGVAISDKDNKVVFWVMIW